jgi:hypothetical protein
MHMQRTIVYFQATKMAKSQKIITHHLYNQKKMAHRLRVEFRKKLTRENLGKPFPPIDWKEVKSIFLSELEVGSFSFYDYCR